MLAFCLLTPQVVRSDLTIKAIADYINFKQQVEVREKSEQDALNDPHLTNSLNIFYCQILYSNGVGSQVLTTLVTTLPLQVKHT